jgi:steroid 5-alpha reductase family enzyme
MALVLVGTAADAASWPTALALIQEGVACTWNGVLDHVTTQAAALGQAYVAADPLVSGTVLMLFFTFLCWLLSVCTGNYSWTDRLWSITPAVYSVHFGFFASIREIVRGNQSVVATVAALFTRTVGGEPNPAVVLPSARLTIVALLPVLWGARLTYNFARKGGYRWDFEDYRWAIVRTWFSPLVYQLFNIVFIAFYQHALLFAFVLPAYVAWRADAAVPALAALDVFAAAAFIGLLVMETVADQQQWVYQTEKYRLLADAASIDDLPPVFRRGFVTTGLFAYSRHPVRPLCLPVDSCVCVCVYACM